MFYWKESDSLHKDDMLPAVIMKFILIWLAPKHTTSCRQGRPCRSVDPTFAVVRSQPDKHEVIYARNIFSRIEHGERTIKGKMGAWETEDLGQDQNSEPSTLTPSPSSSLTSSCQLLIHVF